MCLFCHLTRSTLLCFFFCMQDFQINVAFKLIKLHMYVCFQDLDVLPTQSKWLFDFVQKLYWLCQLTSSTLLCSFLRIQYLKISMVSNSITLSMRMSDTQLPPHCELEWHFCVGFSWGVKYYSHILFFHTSGLLRCQRPQKDKKGQKFF